MFCPKCHTDLKDDAEYCRRCGIKLDSSRKKKSWSSFSYKKPINETKDIKERIIDKEDHNDTHQEQYNYSNNYSKTIIKQVVSEEDYKKALINKNHDLFNQSFSIVAMIFGPFYCIYRKLWTQGILLLIIYLCSYIYIQENTSIFLRIVINLVLAFKFNKLYLSEVDKRVELIKKQNQDFTSTELLEECNKKGGTISIRLIIFIIILFYLAITILISNNNATKYNNNKQDNTIGNITYIIPKTAELKIKYPTYITYTDVIDNNRCYISISTEQSNTNPEEYLISKINSYSNYEQSEIMEESYNDINWIKQAITNNNTTKYFYITKIDNNIYDFSFSSNQSNDACLKDIDIIIKSSIEIKKDA